jgi:transcriptional regulator with XRE-family HTH domain
MVDATTSTGKIVTALRQELRSKGLHYRDVALRLGVSEGTVKRYFSGKGLSLQVLEKLVEVVELDLLSLMALAQQQNNNEPGLSKGQRVALSKSREALMVFHLLGIGFSPAQISREFDLRGRINNALSLLEDIGLIRRLANGGAKTLAKLVIDGNLSSQETERRTQKANVTRRVLSKIDFQNERCEWINSAARLSLDSAARLRDLMDRFARDVLAMTKSDISLPPEHTQWYRLILVADPISRKRWVEEMHADIDKKNPDSRNASR